MAPSLSSVREVSDPRSVWLITGAHAVNEFYSVAFPPILPLLVADFEIGFGEAGALLTVFYAMYSVFQLPAGYVADRVGQTRVLSAGMVVLGAGVFLAGIAPDYETLVVAQALAGVGGSTYHPSGMSLISDIETGATEGRAMGIHGLGGVIGTALAPALIGGLAALYDWRLALAVAAAVGVVYAAVFFVAFDDPDRSGDDDGPAPAADGGGGPAADGRTAPASPERTDLRTRLRRAVNVPLAWWVLGLFAANLLISLEINAVRTFATSYLFERAGESTVVSNGVFFVMLVGGGISSIGAGHLADHLDRRYLGIGVLALSTLSLVATALVPPSPVVLTAWFFVLGLIVYAALPVMNALTSSYSEREFSGSLFGVMLTAGAIGGGVGPLAFGLAAENVGVTTAFPAVAVVAVGAAVVFALMLRV